MRASVPSKACLVMLPSSVDVETYDAISMCFATLANPNGDSSTQQEKNTHALFAAAWNGVGYRVAAAVAYDAEFRQSIAKGGAPGSDERFIQERALFGCTASCLSTIECFFMASYAVGAALAPTSFPITDAKNLVLYPGQIAKAFRAAFPKDAFSQLLNKVSGSPELRALEDVRNVLAHRGVLPRKHFLSTVADRASAVPANPKALSTDFDYSAELTDNTTRAHVTWVLLIINEALERLYAFLPST